MGFLKYSYYTKSILVWCHWHFSSFFFFFMFLHFCRLLFSRVWTLHNRCAPSCGYWYIYRYILMAQRIRDKYLNEFLFHCGVLNKYDHPEHLTVSQKKKKLKNQIICELATGGPVATSTLLDRSRFIHITLQEMHKIMGNICILMQRSFNIFMDLSWNNKIVFYACIKICYSPPTDIRTPYATSYTK